MVAKRKNSVVLLPLPPAARYKPSAPNDDPVPDMRAAFMFPALTTVPVHGWNISALCKAVPLEEPPLIRTLLFFASRVAIWPVRAVDNVAGETAHASVPGV